MDQGLGSMMNDPSQGMAQPQQPMPGMEQMGGGGQDPAALAAQSMPPQMGPGMEMGQEVNSQVDPAQKYIDFALSQTNLAKHLRKKKDGEDRLNKIGSLVVEGYMQDEMSREDWVKNNKDWMKLALLVRENKTFPWPKASNVKFPLIATAAMQFSARAYPSLVPATGHIVTTSLPQKHPNKALVDAARRVSNHLSFQIRNVMRGWEEDMDKLLMTCAISGLVFKKTYYDGVEKVNKSCLVYPENLVVNYYAKNLEDAYRKTEILNYHRNDVRAKVLNDEEFLDVLEDISVSMDAGKEKEAIANKLEAPKEDASVPLVFLSQHTFLDLDEDGLEEPYVVTVHRDSQKVVRIVARFDSDGVTYNEKGDILYIKPVEYFTAFPFIPNPDGSIYALGFGALLGPLNISINTLINQLIDAGTLNNLQSGLIGKGLRVKMGESPLRPGEWRVVNATGDDLSKSIFPLPSKEPSAVLMNLMQLLIQSGNQLASIAEIFVGKMPGQNTPATTTQETVQQSMAVFTAIYKRVYRSLESEFKKLFRLNRMNPDTLESETQLSGIPLQASDYDFPEWMIVPGADPSGDSFNARQQKMQYIGQLIPMGTINPQVFTQKSLEMLELPDVDEWMQPPPQPQPDPKAQAAQAQMAALQQKSQIEGAAAQQEMQMKERLAELEANMKAMDLKFKERELEMKEQEMMLKARVKQMDSVSDLQTKQQQRSTDLAFKEAQAVQKLRAGEETFKQKQSQKEKTSGSGTKN